MKKALIITIIIMIMIEFSFIAIFCNFPHIASKSEIIATSEKIRISKNDDYLTKKVMPIEYERLIVERDFFEDIARYYETLLF